MRYRIIIAVFATVVSPGCASITSVISNSTYPVRFGNAPSGGQVTGVAGAAYYEDGPEDWRRPNAELLVRADEDDYGWDQEDSRLLGYGLAIVAVLALGIWMAAAS